MWSISDGARDTFCAIKPRCQSTLSTRRSSVIMTHVFRKCKVQCSGNSSRQLFLTNKVQIRYHRVQFWHANFISDNDAHLTLIWSRYLTVLSAKYLEAKASTLTFGIFLLGSFLRVPLSLFPLLWMTLAVMSAPWRVTLERTREQWISLSKVELAWE